MYDIQNNADAIRHVQRFLLELYYGMTAFPHVTIDGVYGQKTQDAVQMFQQANGLRPTGQTDFETWSVLYEAYSRMREKREEEHRFLHLEFDSFEGIQGGT